RRAASGSAPPGAGSRGQRGTLLTPSGGWQSPCRGPRHARPAGSVSDAGGDHGSGPFEPSGKWWPRPRRFRPKCSRRVTLRALRPGYLTLARQLLAPLFRVVRARKGDDVADLSLSQGERLNVLVEIGILQAVALVVVAHDVPERLETEHARPLSEAAAVLLILLFEHRPSLVSHEQVVHVVRMLVLLRQNPFEEHPGGRISVAEVAHHLAVGLDGDALGNQVFLDHVDQVLALGVLRGGPGADTVRIQVRLAAELIDPLGEEIEMFLFFLRVLSELFLDRLAGESGGADGVELVAENAHDLRGDRVVQEGDGVFHLAPVVLRDGAFAQMLPSPTPNLLDIRKEPLSSTHCLSSLLH